MMGAEQFEVHSLQRQSTTAGVLFVLRKFYHSSRARSRHHGAAQFANHPPCIFRTHHSTPTHASVRQFVFVWSAGTQIIRSPTTVVVVAVAKVIVILGRQDQISCERVAKAIGSTLANYAQKG